VPRYTQWAAGIAKRIVETVRRMNECHKKNDKPLFTKSVNPHNFRHSRASELGAEPGMVEAVMCKIFGWDVGRSDMPGTYLHLTDEQVKRAVLRVHGRARDDVPKQIETHRICHLCHAENPLGLHYCGTCGKPLAVDAQVSKMGDMEERMLKMEQIMGLMAQQVEVMKNGSPGEKELLKDISMDWSALVANKVWEKKAMKD